jgi:hypothetical protein
LGGFKVELRGSGLKVPGTPRKEKTRYPLTCNYPQISVEPGAFECRNLCGIMSSRKIENALCFQLAVDAEYLIGAGIPHLHGSFSAGSSDIFP